MEGFDEATLFDEIGSNVVEFGDADCCRLPDILKY
jgi:hypothetical protein